MLQIEVGFFPGTPLILHGGDKRYRELPTIPSDLERLREKLEQIPVERIADRAVNVLEGLSNVVNSPELPRILKNLDTSAKELALAITEVRRIIGPAGEKVDATIDDLHALSSILRDRLNGLISSLETAADQVRELAGNASTEVGPLVASLRKASVSTGAAADSAAQAFNDLSGAISEQDYSDGLRAAGMEDVAIRERIEYDSEQLQCILGAEGEIGQGDSACCGGRTDRGETLRELAAECGGKVWSAKVFARKPSA